jgi:hypothetical protein
MLTALVGVIIGTAGLVLSLLNYFRDRPKVIVRLVWHNLVTDEHRGGKTSCEIIVTNVGRRPIFISHAHLSYPDTPVVSLLIDSVAGAKLLEGDPPKSYLIEDTAGKWNTYAAEWWKVRARVMDHTGKNWWSTSVTHRHKPEWGTGPAPASWQWLGYRLMREAPVIRSIRDSVVRKRKRETT